MKSISNEIQRQKQYANSFGNIMNCVSVITSNIFMAFETFIGRPDFAASLFDSEPEFTFSTYKLSYKIPL